MKTILVILVWTAASIAQASEWTALIATEGAMVTIEKSITPAPTPDSAPIGNPAEHGKMTLDIRVPGTCPPDASCRNGRCPLRSGESTPPADSPHTQAEPSEACAGGVCPSAPSTKEGLTLRAIKRAAGCVGQGCNDPITTRTRWRLFRR